MIGLDAIVDRELPKRAEFDVAQPLNFADAAPKLIYPGVMLVAKKPSELPRLIAEMRKKVERGETDFPDLYKGSSLVPYVRIIENWLRTYEALNEETLSDKLDNLLGNIKIPGMGFPLKVVRSMFRRVAHPYVRPDTLSAMHPRSLEKLLGLAYWATLPEDKRHLGYDTIGMPTGGMMTFMTMVKEMNLYDDPTIAIQYLVDHELMHKKHPPERGLEAEDALDYEFEVRERVYRMYVERIGAGETASEKRYKRLAAVALAFIEGHAGQGLQSYIPAKRLIESKVSDIREGRFRPDALGDELYRGQHEDKDSRNMQPPGSGSNHPDAQRAYRAEIGKPLVRLPDEYRAPETHEAAQHEAAQHSNPASAARQYESGRSTQAQHQPARHQPAKAA